MIYIICLRFTIKLIVKVVVIVFDVSDDFDVIPFSLIYTI